MTYKDKNGVTQNITFDELRRMSQEDREDILKQQRRSKQSEFNLYELEIVNQRVEREKDGLNAANQRLAEQRKRLAEANQRIAELHLQYIEMVRR